MKIDRDPTLDVHVLLDALALGDQPGGVGRYISNLIAGFRQLEAPPRLTIAVRDSARDAIQVGPDTSVVGPGRAASLGPARLLWEQLLLPRRVVASRCQLVHGLMGVVPLRTQVAQVATIHDVTFFTHPELHTRAKVAYFRAMLPRVAAVARRVLTDSNASKAAIVEVLNVAPAKIHVVPLSIDPGFVPASAIEVADVKRRLDLDAPFILYAGVIEPRKNLVRLIEAMRELRAHGLPHQLVIAGKLGWNTDNIVAMAAAAGSLVRMLGYVSDVDLRSLLSACSAFAYIPLVEGFGLPAAEALACGAVVVTSQVSSLPEVVGDAAMLVDPTDVGSIAAGLTRAIEDEATRQYLQQRGPARARELSPKALAQGTLDVYRQVLSEN